MKYRRIAAFLLAGALGMAQPCALAADEYSDISITDGADTEQPDYVPEEPEQNRPTYSEIARGDYGRMHWSLLENGQMTISGNSSMGWTGQAPWQQYRSMITSLKVEDGISVIKGFEGCESLTSVELARSVRTVDDSAFKDCTALSSVSTSGAVTIGERAFQGCSSLSNIKLPNTLTALESYAFMQSGLTSVSVPSTLKQFGNTGSVFYDCDRLRTAEIGVGSGSFSIPADCFRGCDALENVNIGKAVWYIRENAFSDCTSLKSVTIGKNVAGLGWMSFSGCTSLEEITVPDYTKVIEYGTFANCTALQKVTIGEGMRALNGSNFVNCISLRSVYFYGNKPTFANNRVFSGDTAIAYYPDTDSTWVGMGSYGGNIAWGTWTLPISRRKPAIKSISQPRKKTLQVKLCWEKAHKADGYYVFRKKGQDGEWKLRERTSSTSFKDKKVKKNTTYYYRIVAYRGTDMSKLSDMKSITVVKIKSK